jgi:uncharacterized protein
VSPPTPSKRNRVGIAPALGDAEIGELDDLLAALPDPLQPPDVSALDGFLAGLALQWPRPVESQWLPLVSDLQGRPAPPGAALEQLRALARRRLVELDARIEQRQWFDPIVFELTDATSPSEAVLPWVAGFALAIERFPAFAQVEPAAVLEPLAALYRHFPPDDLEDATELVAQIELLDPPRDLGEAVEDLVRSTLLLADLSRPRRSMTTTAGTRGRSRPAARRRRHSAG